MGMLWGVYISYLWTVFREKHRLQVFRNGMLVKVFDLRERL